MTPQVGQIERLSQTRVVDLLKGTLGYDYLGNWEYREGNANVEVKLLTGNLEARLQRQPGLPRHRHAALRRLPRRRS